MGRKSIVTLVILVSFLFCTAPSFAQSTTDAELLQKLIKYTSELEFELALEHYVQKLFLVEGVENLPQEKYLITLMHLTNREMRKRIANPRASSDKYFKELYSQLDELSALKSRLKTSKTTELNSYIDELEARLKMTIRKGEVNYKKKKVFEDALQLLYVAEEMIKMDQLQDKSNLNKKISRSKDKLLSAFGEVGNVETQPLGFKPTIFNLYQEWKKTESYKFATRLLDVKIVRSNLIKSGSVRQIMRMFNNELRVAYGAFNYYDYDLAERLLEDLIETYSTAGIKDFEDIYFYWGESNFALSQLNRAQDIYLQLIQHYPASAYLAKTYSRLVQINYILNNPSVLLDYYSKYQNVASNTNEEYYDIQFIAALALYQQSDFNRAIDLLLSFPQKSPYYYLAQYLVGTAYASGQNLDMAADVFTKLIQGKAVPVDIYSRSLYKLAIINYQREAYLSAIEYLNMIPQNYYRYDKVLNVLAWSFFMFEKTRTDIPEERDYSQAKYFARQLIDNYYASEHRMEAESLLGYIYQMENNPNLALGLYRDVYQSKASRKKVDSFLEERDQLQQLYGQAKKIEEEALRKNNAEAYIQATDVAKNLEENLYKLDLSEASPVGSEISNEVYGVINQLNRVLVLKEKARASGNKAAIAKADSLIIRLSAALDYVPEDYLRYASSYNLFDAYPVARKVAEYDFQKRKTQQLRQAISQELSLIDDRVTSLQQQVERAKLKGDYIRVATLEQKISKLKEIRKKNDQLYASTFELNIGQPYPEFDQWGDFGAFGVIDVNFGQRSRLQHRMGDLSALYNSVNKAVGKRRAGVEDKLKKIEAEIRFMTMKARMAERVRQRAERERSFRESYFDKRTSEFEEK